MHAESPYPPPPPSSLPPLARKGIPLRALQHQICDVLTRQSIRPTLTASNTQALEADLRARETQLERGLTPYFEGNAPPKALLNEYLTAHPQVC